MKRSELKRKTQLKRSTKPLKRTPLRRVSKKQRKLLDAVRKIRQAYLRDHPFCECEKDCGAESQEVHEITAGAQHRWKAVGLPSCLLALHSTCHRRLQGMPYAVQLGCKLYASPETFRLEQVLQVLGRADGAIAIAEVIAAMPKKPKSLDDCLLDYENWKRKVTLLTRQLNEAQEKLHAAASAYQKASARESAIAKAAGLTK